jgi:Zn-dependent membrane protease YugP
MRPGIWLILVALIIVPGLIAQMRVRSAFGRYSRVRARSGLSGADAAAAILHAAGIHDVEIRRTESYLGDHYDPLHKRLVLSPPVYSSDSLAALGVAAHEAGHAIQHARGYAPLRARMAVVPATMFVSQLMPLVVIGGFFFHIFEFIVLGIAVYAVIVLFNLITLPVEFNASARARQLLVSLGLVGRDELPAVNRVLNAAALTYVAALVAAVAHLLLLILRAQAHRR